METTSRHSLDWIVGRWMTGDSASQFSEEWTKISDTLYRGRGAEIRADGSVAFSEALEIYSVGDTYVYKVKLNENEEAVLFTEHERTSSSITFVNPSHDFPQEIRYEHTGIDQLHASIAGPSTSGTKTIDFYFNRIH